MRLLVLVLVLVLLVGATYIQTARKGCPWADVERYEWADCVTQ
ncbi:MAG: hypothetical protein WBW08_09665 [Methyloceanibacter sp.]